MDNEKYQLYDETVAFLMNSISSQTKGQPQISLGDFCPSSREHLVVLYAALYSASLRDKKVALNLSLLSYAKFWLTHKDMRQYYVRKGEPVNVSVPHLIGEVFANVRNADQFNGTIGDIYDEYYKPVKVAKPVRPLRKEN